MYEKCVKSAGFRVLALDDYGQTQGHCCDLLLDSNAGTKKEFYRDRESSARLLLGTRYVLLQGQHRWRPQRRIHLKSAKRLLVSLGGAPEYSDVMNVLTALHGFGSSELEVTVALPASVASHADFGRYPFPVNIQHDPSRMRSFMDWAEVAIISAGGTLWELLHAGTPVLSFSRNRVQESILSLLATGNVVGYLGRLDSFGSDHLVSTLRAILGSKLKRAEMSRKGRALVDGRGCDRVMAAMQEGTTLGP